jgi:hypothetical protein
VHSIHLDATPLSQQAVALQDLLSLSARRVQALPLLSGVLPTVYSVISPAARAIGRSDLARSQDPRCCPWESKPRNPDGQKSTSGYFHSSASLDLSIPRVPKLRCHASAPHVLHYASGVPLCSFTFGTSRIAESTTPSPLLLETPNAESPMLRIRATCPSRNLRSRSNRGIALRGFDVHAILALANPDLPICDGQGFFCCLRANCPAPSPGSDDHRTSRKLRDDSNR